MENITVDTVQDNDTQQKSQQQQQRPKRKRWGERPVHATQESMGQPPSQVENQQNIVQNHDQSLLLDPKAKILAMQESIRARLAAAKAQQQSSLLHTNSTASSIVKRPINELQHNQQPTTTKRAKVYDLDLSITAPTFQDDDKHIQKLNDPKSVIQSSTTPQISSSKEVHIPPTRQTNKTSIKPTNPYLAYQGESGSIEESEIVDETMYDPRVVRMGKIRKRHKEFHFIEPGKYQQIASTKREKEMKAIASGYLSGRKMGHTIIAPTVASIDAYTDTSTTSTLDIHPVLPPRPEYDDTISTMPMVMEWWDTEFLPSKLKKLVAAEENKILIAQTTKKTKVTSHTENDSAKDAHDPMDVESEVQILRDKCYDQASFSYSKTGSLVQHIVPIQPTNIVAAESNKKQLVLHLTKKELKRQRKLRRQEKRQEQQDLQAAGLLPAPEPRLTLRNFIQVLGDQAFLDPSQIEQKVQEQMSARQNAHLQRNEAAKLTKEQRSAKLARKLEEDTTASVTTALFYVKDMSHPYHRAKVDLNAQQMNLSGCVVECTQDPSFACIIVEGGPKAIKRFKRLMLVRMKWTGPDGAIDDDEDEIDAMGDDGMDKITHKFNSSNICEAVWQGMAVKRLLQGFIFQACETHDQGRKILKAKGASHFWDQVLQHASTVGQSRSLIKVKLLHGDDDIPNDKLFERKH